MVRLTTLLLSLGALAALPSCNNDTSNDGKTTVVHDSLVHIFPTWQALKINLSDDKTEMNIVMGDAMFYNVPPDVKTQKADELGRMILRIYGKNNYLSKGKLIVTKDINNTSDAPADGITLPVDFERLKKGEAK